MVATHVVRITEFQYGFIALSLAAASALYGSALTARISAATSGVCVAAPCLKKARDTSFNRTGKVYFPNATSASASS